MRQPLEAIEKPKMKVTKPPNPFAKLYKSSVEKKENLKKEEDEYFVDEDLEGFEEIVESNIEIKKRIKKDIEVEKQIKTCKKKINESVK